MKNEAQMKSDR